MIYNYRRSEDALICLQKKTFDYLFLCWGQGGNPWCGAGGQLHKIDGKARYDTLGPTILTEW